MKAHVVILGLLLALVGPAHAQGSPPRRPPLVFSGNLVLNDEVYLAVLDLPPDFAPDKSGAALVRSRLLTFLHRAGYELARVETAVEGNRILVDIDEGRVEKLILRGQGSLRTVQVLLSLSLPHNVFNRPYLERQLADLHAQSGVEFECFKKEPTGTKPSTGTECFKLVPTSEVKHVGPQVEDLGPIVDDIGRFVGHPLIPPRADYELHIFLRRREWATGLGVVAGLGGGEGLRLGAEYRGEGLALAKDRWSAGAQLGAKIRSRISNDRAYLALTRAQAELHWYTPRLRLGLRPVLTARGELISRQRPDIGLESYYAMRAQLTLGLSYDLFRGATVALGVGGEELDVFGLKPAMEGVGPAAGVGPSSTLRPYLSSTAHLVFDMDEVRRDRRTELEFNGRQYPRESGRGYGVISYRFQRVNEVGWHDLMLTSRGAWLWGNVPFIEEQPVGGLHVRGVFDDRFYAKHVASGGMEVRFSLTRDIYKVGGFADVAVFGELDRGSGSEKPRVVGSAGPSFHVLIADVFQLDLYYALGFAGHGEAERGFTAALRQAF
ncbi:hypothetical protein [Hyalangium minutum]|uniref:Bacterial surface antigen (D15) domain-containing protein n=1 Tax=Hyalangium minutum TaxID=394096 RepID=A0A085WXR3_9BACT|nr:hypothetical protein [Hyalangium minutum]KFE72476.1 hypothetical protein DB31_0739 [Hyalangium minutum]